jgi:hypothetical protein
MRQINYTLAICVMLWVPIASGQQTSATGTPQPVRVAPPRRPAITGVYNGSYRCARGPVKLKLTLVAPGDGSLTGVFMFDLPANSRTRTASYTLSGTYDGPTGEFRLVPVEWEPPAPPGYVMVGMDGSFNSSAEQVSGKITYATCTTFEAARDKAQSVALPHRPAVTPAAPVARSAPANANQTSASAAAHPVQVAPAAGGTALMTSAPQRQDAPPPPPAGAVAGCGVGANCTAPTTGLAVSFCFSDYERSPIYFSEIFGTNIPGLSGNTLDIYNAFNAYLKQKYADKNISNYSVGCLLFRSTSDAEARKQALEAEWKRANKQTIETGWKWVLPPGTAVASGKGKPSYCAGAIRGGDMYFSDIFEMPPNTPLYPLLDGFGRFVIEKYRIAPGRSWDGGVVCPSGDNKDQDKQYWRERGYKIIETGWKPKSLPPPNMGP